MRTNTKDKVKTYVVELSNRCSEGCAFCYSISYDSINKKPRKNQINKFGWTNVLENIVANGAEAIDFSGGEPTINPDFSEILKKSKSLGLNTIVSTNGSTYKNKKIRHALENYADCIALSIHGIGKDHDKIKQREGSYDSVINSYEHYQNIGKRLKINTTVCKENKNEILELGDILNIENSGAQWKLSQVAFRESGKINKKSVRILNKEFEKICNSIKIRFPKAYSQGRITFRENDSQNEKFKFVPYLISSSEGKLYIPIGEQHLNLGISLLDDNYYKKLEKVMDSLANFPEAVNNNHQKFYGNLIKEKNCKSCFSCPRSYYSAYD